MLACRFFNLVVIYRSRELKNIFLKKTKMEKQEKKITGNNFGGADEASSGLKFINPSAIIDTLEITTGMLIGDFGAGTGYFTFPLAQKVGDSGVVYALDILKEKLEAIESEAKILGLNNVVTKRANLEMTGGSKLEADSLDLVCLVNMLFQNKSKNLIFEEAVRVLKKSGKVLVIEWNMGDSTFGPTSDLRISKTEILKLAKDCGLTIVREIEISHFHFGIIFEK